MGKKILLIEDDAYVRDLYQTVLAKEGYDVSIAEDGEKALEVVGQGSFDLILLDIMLPKLTGIDVLKRLKADDATKDISVYLLTNLGDEGVIDEAFKLGANGYLLKAKYLPKQMVKEVNKFFLKTSPEQGDDEIVEEVVEEIVEETESESEVEMPEEQEIPEVEETEEASDLAPQV